MVSKFDVLKPLVLESPGKFSCQEIIAAMLGRGGEKSVTRQAVHIWAKANELDLKPGMNGKREHWPIQPGWGAYMENTKTLENSAEWPGQ